jgi:hypothetical protein
LVFLGLVDDAGLVEVRGGSSDGLAVFGEVTTALWGA